MAWTVGHGIILSGIQRMKRRDGATVAMVVEAAIKCLTSMGIAMPKLQPWR